MEKGVIAEMSIEPARAGKERRILSVASASANTGAGAPSHIECEWADRFVGRLLGLMGRPGLRMGAGLVIVPCSGIHMWFMRFPIDAVFLARGSAADTWKVTSVHEGLRPWKLLPVGDRMAGAVLELPAGSAARYGIRAGGELKCIG